MSIALLPTVDDRVISLKMEGYLSTADIDQIVTAIEPKLDTTDGKVRILIDNRAALMLADALTKPAAADVYALGQVFCELLDRYVAHCLPERFLVQSAPLATV